MADDKQSEDQQDITLKNMKSINPNTQIVFTLKGFIVTLLTILGLFVGFHKMVIVPTLEDHEKTIQAIQDKSDAKFENINNKLIEITNGIGTINGNIEGINNRFKDLNSTIHHEDGGSFNK